MLSTTYSSEGHMIDMFYKYANVSLIYNSKICGGSLELRCTLMGVRMLVSSTHASLACNGKHLRYSMDWRSVAILTSLQMTILSFFFYIVHTSQLTDKSKELKTFCDLQQQKIDCLNHLQWKENTSKLKFKRLRMHVHITYYQRSQIITQYGYHKQKFSHWNWWNFSLMTRYEIWK